MKALRRHAAFAAVILTASAAPIGAAQQHQSHRVQYEASLYGLPIGRAVFESRFEGQGFAISGSFASAGVARLFDRTDGTVTVNGWMGKDATRPNEYRLDYTSGDRESKKTKIRFAEGRVAETENVPEPKKRAKDWVPVEREHLSGVVDPLSALLLPAGSEAEVCNRTLSVYDGEMRVDFVLEPAPRSRHLPRAAVTCQARFVPVAGYRTGRSTIAYLRDRARILVGFQPANGIYTPVEATIGTRVGTVHVRARQL